MVNVVIGEVTPTRTVTMKDCCKTSIVIEAPLVTGNQVKK